MTAPPPVGPDPLRRRCAEAARDRGDDQLATAPPTRRQLLVEVPGPWGRTALTESRLDHYVAGRLADAAGAAGVRVLLVRRPGRVPGPGDPRAWALCDTTADRAVMRWGSWTDPHQLMRVDLRAAVHPDGPQRVALVCTHTRHDICCALHGRGVVTALAARTDWDVWESSHVGGDRFAANLLLLPSGQLFGRLDPQTAVDVVRRYDAGRIDVEHWRGRFGSSPVEQAALALAAREFEDDRLGAVRVIAMEERPNEQWAVAVAHTDPSGVEQRYLLRLTSTWRRPQLLTCAAVAPSRSRSFDLDGPPKNLTSG